MTYYEIAPYAEVLGKGRMLIAAQGTHTSCKVQTGLLSI